MSQNNAFKNLYNLMDKSAPAHEYSSNQPIKARHSRDISSFSHIASSHPNLHIQDISRNLNDEVNTFKRISHIKHNSTVIKSRPIKTHIISMQSS